MSSAADPIQQQYETFVDGMKRGDVSQLVRFLEDGIVFMPPADMTIVGRDQVQSWYQDYFEYFTILTLETIERDVQNLGECLIERSAVSVKLEPRKGGTPIYDEARILSVWRRQPGGGWKIVQSMWNSVKPIGAGTNRFLVRFMNRGE